MKVCLFHVRRLNNPCIVSDVNECQNNVCMADATCKNTEGSYNCTCNSGLKMELNLCVGKLATKKKQIIRDRYKQ